MARTHIDLEFADGQYRFALGLEQLNEIQIATGDGIGAVVARVLQGRVMTDIDVGHPGYGAYKVADLVATVRQGLIGGKMGIVDGKEVSVGPMRANQLVENYLHPMPLNEQWKLAAAILFAKVEGYDEGEAEPVDDDKKKAPSEGGSITPEPSPTV